MKETFLRKVRKMKNVYPVFFTKTDECILVEVPDFGILTEGKDMSEAIDMARDAIELNCFVMEDNKEDIPQPSNINNLDINNGIFTNNGNTTVLLVNVDSMIYRKKIECDLEI